MEHFGTFLAYCMENLPLEWASADGVLGWIQLIPLNWSQTEHFNLDLSKFFYRDNGTVVWKSKYNDTLKNTPILVCNLDQKVFQT